MVEEGWYTDPQDSTRLRYWDGEVWTEHTHDRPDDEPELEEAVVAEPSPAEQQVEEPQVEEPQVEEPQVAEPAPAVEPAAVAEPPPEESVHVEPSPEQQPSIRWMPERAQAEAPPPHPAPVEPPPPSPHPAPVEPPPPSPHPAPVEAPAASIPSAVSFSRSQQYASPPSRAAYAPPAPAPRPPAPVETYHPPAPVPPPHVPDPGPEPDLGSPIAQPGRLNDISQWLGRTFKVGLAKLMPCGLLVVLGLVPAVFFYTIAYLALSEISDDGLRGTTVVMVLLVALLFVVWMLWVGVVTLAQNHLLYQAHIGRGTSIARSLQAGLQGIGRLAWAYLTLVVYGIMIVAVVGGLTLLFSLVSDTLGGIFFVVAYVAALTLTIWLGVKLIFLVVAAAVAPPGDRPMVVSVDTTNGYFWAVLGRLLLLGLILSAALVPVMLIVGGLFGAVGTSFVNDPDSGTATALIGAIAVGGVLYLIVTLGMQVFSTSGIVRLYVDLGGPAQPEPEPEPATVPQ